MVDIIDIGMGNVQSIINILVRLGINPKVAHTPDSLSSKTLILPGVGSALPFMQKLCEYSFDKAILDHVKQGKRIIGICLGFQVMTEFSEEDGGTNCLGIINTQTISIKKHYHSSNHNQWETFSLRKDDLHLSEQCDSILTLRKRVVHGRVFYNHEYGVKINSDDIGFSRINSDSLSSFASMYSNDNIIGLQFHPEKSQDTGLQLFSLLL